MLASDSLRLNHARPALLAFEHDLVGKPVPTFPDHALALHQIDIFDRDRAAVAEIDHENGEPDGGLRSRHRQDQQRKDLADEIAKEGRERDEIDIDRQQDQLDRHQDDDDVLPVEEDAEDAEREQDRRNSEVMAEPDGHDTPCPGRTLTTSIAVALVRATCSATFCRFTFSRWRSVSTIAPTMATSSTSPAAWK